MRRSIAALTGSLAMTLTACGPLTSIPPGGPDSGPGVSPDGGPVVSPDGGVLAIHVSGNTLVDGAGHVLQLRGVNRSGTEYSCVHGDGIFDGPSDDASLAVIASWHVSSVRVLLNEDCWLGINGVASSMGGAAYQNAIIDYVRRIHQHGMFVELSLIWAAPGTQLALDQAQMPDQEHSIPFWTSVATAFKDDPAIIFGVYGEVNSVDWSCWRDGGSSCSLSYAAAGMQQLVETIRATGARQPIAVPGIDYANNLSQWLAHAPNDSAHQLVAEAHVYGGNSCDSTTCFDSELAPVAAQVPLLWGETGEDYQGVDCGSTNITSYLAWADAHGVSYEAWTWDTWGDCLSLISDYNGTINGSSQYASFVRSHYAARAP